MNIVTLTNKKYIPGTLALIKSIGDYSGLKRLKFIVLHEDDVEPPDIDRINSIGVKTEMVLRSDVGELDKLDYTSDAFNVALQKLVIFKLPYKRLHYIDSDIICLREVREMEKHEPLTATLVYSRNMKNSINGYPMFSAGKFCFEPSQGLYEDIVKYLKANVSDKWYMPDQFLLNHYYYEKNPNDVHLLDIEWEMLNHLYRYRPVTWQSRKPRFIHYCNNKPWLGGMGPKYRPIEKLWWGVYNDIR
jgi:lipopolysaccharide biosynthesis glycosyltransferase